jgi:hypothetical protein
MVYFLIDTVYRSDRLYKNKARGGGRVLTVILTSLGFYRCRHYLELYSEYVWVEIPTLDEK